MALLEGKTPEQIAAETIKQATEEKLLMISAQAYAQLVKLTRYNNRTTIFNRGEKSWTQNAETWIRESLEKLIDSRFDQLEKQMDKAQKDAANEYFQLLVSRGMDLKKAYAEAFGIEQVEIKTEVKADVPKTEEKPATTEVSPAKK